MWLFDPLTSDQRLVIVAKACSVLAGLEPTGYSVDAAGGGACDLLIDAVKAEHAGVYSCLDVELSDQPASAQLVVLGQIKHHQGSSRIRSIRS